MKYLLLALSVSLIACSSASPSIRQPPVTATHEPHIYVDAFGAAVDCPAEFDTQCRADGLLPEAEAGYGGISVQYAPSTTEIPLFVVSAQVAPPDGENVPAVGTLIELHCLKAWSRIRHHVVGRSGRRARDTRCQLSTEPVAQGSDCRAPHIVGSTEARASPESLPTQRPFPDLLADLDLQHRPDPRRPTRRRLSLQRQRQEGLREAQVGRRAVRLRHALGSLRSPVMPDLSHHMTTPEGPQCREESALFSL